jgi:hypothetical protein
MHSMWAHLIAVMFARTLETGGINGAILRRAWLRAH